MWAFLFEPFLIRDSVRILFRPVGSWEPAEAAVAGVGFPDIAAVGTANSSVGGFPSQSNRYAFMLERTFANAESAARILIASSQCEYQTDPIARCATKIRQSKTHSSRYSKHILILTVQRFQHVFDVKCSKTVLMLSKVDGPGKQTADSNTRSLHSRTILQGVSIVFTWNR